MITPSATSYISLIFSNFYFLLVVEVIAFFLKIFYVGALFRYSFRLSKFSASLIFLFIAFTTSTIINFSWIIRLCKLLELITIPENVSIFITRSAWLFSIFYYPALILFIGSLIKSNYYKHWTKQLIILITFLAASCFLYVLFFYADSYYTLVNYIGKSTYVLMLIGLIDILYVCSQEKVPRILKRQIKLLILGIICPQLFFDFLQIYPFLILHILTTNFSVLSLSTFCSTFFIFYCARKIMTLRFLNIKPHVQASVTTINFLETFKDILDQLSHTTKTQELNHITKTFFNLAFGIPMSKTIVAIRNLSAMHLDVIAAVEEKETNPLLSASVVETIENLITADKTIGTLQQMKILIRDEIEFNNFYEQSTTNKVLLAFLNAINADVFIPIYQRQTVIAYIIILQDARRHKFVSNIECDQIILFINYLGNVINFLQNRNVTALIKKEKEMKEELYSKHQEINQYKESIRIILKNNQQRSIGIIFYKNRKFIFANQEAKTFIPERIEYQEGNPLAKQLKKLIKSVQDSHSVQKVLAKNGDGNKIVLTGVPTSEQNLIIIAYYPEVSDLLKDQMNLLKDPTAWDYLLYLETTQSGKLINQLIPSNSETMLNFKIDLLKIALSRKAILLQLQEEDLQSFVEIIHHISLREMLHTLHLKSYEKNAESAIRLFGINPIFGATAGEALLQQLDGVGTLFIENVHFLSFEAQQYLAEFIRYSFFHVFKSDQTIIADVRIICSTNQNLQTLVQEGKFSKELYNELTQTSLQMPSLLTLPEKEVDSLVDSFAEQALKIDAFKNILELNEREKRKILDHRPASLHEFKAKIQQLLIAKSKKSNIYQETQFDPAYNISDPTLMEAARLGKHALKEPKIMNYLWNKFKSQNKIAAFLGVNRSSVNRRCKEYEIH